MILQRLEDADRKLLRDHILYPGLSLFGPFTPLMVISELPFTMLVFAIAVLDYFCTTTGRICRSYVPMYRSGYILIFAYCCVLRGLIQIVEVEYALVIYLTSPVLIVGWGSNLIRGWGSIVSEAKGS